MRGAGRVRRCDACAEDVHDLSRMTEPEALAYVLKRGGRLCTRAPTDENGEIVLAAGRARPPGRAAALLAATLGAAVAACSGSGVVAAPTATPSHLPARPAAPAPFGPLALTELPASAAPGGDADQDADGIPDATDACPADPGQASVDPKKNGCPAMVVIMSSGITILEHVHFARGSTQTSPDSDPILRATAEALKADPSITRMEVGGHASTDDPNPQKTSEARANEVLARLVAIGVDRARLVAKGYGATHPIDSNATEEGREQNRRVEFLVVGTHP
jgi:outer membrane protein OmpA-like peptidoglycan-associated protein